MSCGAVQVWLLCAAGVVHAASAEVFQLPTANHALFERGSEEKFFAGTVGKPWMSGTFGCVRSDGGQMHEGLDIRCLQRDKRGEPVDPVMATADGDVVHINARPSLSNYGNYIVLRHRIDGVEIYSTYAHLSSVRAGLKVGQNVQGGEVIGTMGRTTNTREPITKDRAHVHFELNLFINDRFSVWHKKTFPDQRNDHGIWNGQNLIAIDPLRVFLEQRRLGTNFNLTALLFDQAELCRAFVRDTDFPWLKRYPQFVRANPRVEKEGIVGYEVALNFNGVPFQLTPRTATEIKGKARVQFLSVNESEQRRNPCRHLVTQRKGRWELSTHGLNLLALLVF